LATKIDPRSKTIDLANTTLSGSDYLELEFGKLNRDGASASTTEAQPARSDSFMTTIFTKRSTPSKNEVQQYIEMEAIGPYDDPLKWWAARSSSLPLVSLLARKYLAIPATSVPSERLFSDCGHVMSKRRTRLSARIFGKIVFCRANRKRYASMFPDIEDIDSEEIEDTQESDQNSE
jgi:hypothetical protein